MRTINIEKIQKSSYTKLSEIGHEKFIELQKKEQFKNKIFTMEIAQQSGYAITGHDKLLSFW